MQGLRPLDAPYIVRYLARAPVALALERAHECEIYRGRTLTRPVLDLGCGDGLFGEVLFGRGAGVCYGLDPDGVELAAARRRAVYRTLLQACGDAIPLPDGACATVLSNSVAEHIPRLHATLRDVHRVLRRDGELLITVPTDRYERYFTFTASLERLGLGSVATTLRRRFNAFWRHFHAMPVAEWRATLAAAGFETLETIEYAPAAVCRFLSVMTPAAVPALLARRLLGRWTLVPSLRSRLAPSLAGPLRRAVRIDCSDGGLVFMRARRQA
jgi:SAM-dependent methyltransferase